MTTDNTDLGRWLDARHAGAVAFLAELVKVPSDTPPGDNTPHAQRAAALLSAMGFEVERHEVPAATVGAAGLRSITNLVLRHRFRAGPIFGLNAPRHLLPPRGAST